MVLNHLAAILFFSGPLLYCGLWMAIAPTGFAKLIEFGIRMLRLPWWRSDVPHRIRLGIRWVGIAVAVFAIAL